MAIFCDCTIFCVKHMKSNIDDVLLNEFFNDVLF